MNDTTQDRVDQLVLSLKHREHWLVGIESAAYLAVILTAFLGNIMLTLAIYKTRTLRSPQNYYLVSLAATDILNAVSSMPFTLVVLIKGTWPFGEFVCQLQGVMWVICGSVSLLTLGMIAFNRYVKIVRSTSLYQKIFSRRNILISIALSLTGVIFFSLFSFSLNETIFSFHPGKCLCFWKRLNLTDKSGFYYVFFYIFLITVTFTTILFSYCKVLQKIRAHFVQVANSSLHNNNAAAFAEEIKITTMLFVTILAFFICWSPSICIDFYELICDDKFMFSRQLYLLNTFTFQSSSAINPLIYGLMKRKFREGYKKVLYCRDC